MTYCVAMSLDAGMIFASDSRTNAGVDQIARFSKMKVFAKDGDRVIVTLSSGNFLIGGQIRGEQHRLFNVYGEGNFIEASPDTCYFQIGESKYGKPVIDRVVTRSTSLLDATKCTVVSFDSTMRSNISVGLPIDLIVYEADSLTIKLHKRIEESDVYFQMVHREWGEGLRRVFQQLPDPDWT